MKKYKLLLLALFTLTILSAQNEIPSPLIVNEVGLMSSTSSKYIELVVAGNPDIPENPVDLEDWILDNNSDGFSNDSIYLSFGNSFANVMPGAIILIYDEGNPHPDINTQNDGLPNSNGMYQLGFNSPALNRCVKGSNYDCNGPVLSATNWNSSLNLNSTGDAVQLRDPSKALRQAISWTTDFVGNGAIPTTGIEIDSPVITLDGRCGDHTFQYKGTSEATPGAANSDVNAYFVQSFLSTTQPLPPPVQISAQGNSATANNNGEIQVFLSDGLSPYTISWSGPSSNYITLPDSEAFTIEGLAPGTYEVSVEDGFGCHSAINVTVGTTSSSIPVSVSCTSQPSSGNDGSIEVIVSQGTPTYSIFIGTVLLLELQIYWQQVPIPFQTWQVGCTL